MATDVKGAARRRGLTLPAILLANDLIEGDTIFRGKGTWERDPARAKVAHDEATAELLESEGSAAAAANLVVDPYLVVVKLDADGRPVPTHFREATRITGPTVRPDLGKQAEFA